MSENVSENSNENVNESPKETAARVDSLANVEAREDVGTAEKTSKPPKVSAKTSKIRLNLELTEDHPLAMFVQTLKERGLKQVDFTTVVGEALETAPAEFWQEKLDVLTPIEYRFNRALKNPKMLAKLKEVLSDCEGSDEEDGELH